jgi:hypothetical protein
VATFVHTPIADEADPGRPRRRWVTATLVLVCTLIATMWVYAFVFASKKGVYFVTDKAWRTAADQICVQATAERLALTDTTGGFISHPTHEQMTKRADIVDQATAVLGRMVDDIEALPLTGVDDRERVSVFVKYYRQILADRHAYTARLRAFDPGPYRETAVNGSPVTNTVIDFTTGNAIPHCMPPGELGGSSI